MQLGDAGIDLRECLLGVDLGMLARSDWLTGAGAATATAGATGASTAPVKIGMIRAERFMGILLEGCGTAIGADQ